MIILHASASSGRLVFWGEASLESTEKPARKPVRRNGQRRLRPSRFALDVDRLSEVLEGLADGLEIAKAQQQQWTAWLPSNEHGALPSSALLCDIAEEPGDGKLEAWKTPVVVLNHDQGSRVLLAVMDRTTCGPGVVAGKTLAYWTMMLRFAGAIVARQHYLPGLDSQGAENGTLARWEPVLLGEDRLECERLAQSMPHACRALCQDEAEPPQAASSGELRAVVAKFVDHLVRTAAMRTGTGPRQFSNLHDKWLSGLRSEGGGVTGDAAELGRLAEEVRRWRRPVEVAAQRHSGFACGWKSRSTALSAVMISGGLAICCKRWRTRVCSCPSRLRGRCAGMKRSFCIGTDSTRESTCFRRSGRPRRSVRALKRVSSRLRRLGIRSILAVRTNSFRSARRRLSRRASECFFLRGGRGKGRTCDWRHGPL